MDKTVAFFCLEYAIEDHLPIYAGGLGVLAADYLLEAGESGADFIGLGLFYREHLSNPTAAGFSLLKDQYSEPIWVDVEIKTRPILLQVWLKKYGSAALYLLDTNVSSNEPEDKSITQRLYTSDNDLFSKQQLALSIGGVKLLHRLGIDPDIYHLNEGHTAYAILALAGDYLAAHPQDSLSSALDQVKQKIVATKHTILPGAGRFLDKTGFKNILGLFCERHKISADELFNLGTSPSYPKEFSTTNFLIKYSIRANAVSRLHAEYEKQVHPDSRLIPITNGVNLKRWQDPSWQNNSDLTAEKIFAVHQENKKKMFAALAKNLDLQILTIIWARRIISYKRPHLLFSDIERLTKLVASPERPVQVIFCGRANPSDQLGQEMLEEIISHTKLPRLKGKVVYLPDYSLPIAESLVSGADIWLNTPETGQEACGTSGMKAGLNGALMVSTNDGWIGEVDWKNIGWIISEDNIEDNLYSVLENAAKTYYDDKTGWAERMKQTRDIVTKNYTTARMLKEYVEKLYFPKM